MPTIKLTEKSIARLKAPDPSGKQVLHWGAGLGGLAVLCSGVTDAKSYVVQRALPGGRTRRVTIGSTRVLSLAEATERAKEIIGQFYLGRDPKTARRGDPTLRSALAEYLALPHLRPKSIEGYRESIENYLGDWLDLPLRTLSREMVLDRLGSIAKDVAAGGRYRGHATANATMRSLRAIYRHAADNAAATNPLPANPVRLGKAWMQVEPRTRHLAAGDLPAFYAAVTALPNSVHRDYLLLILFTGLRRSEAAGLKWEHVDLANKVIRLPASATKAKRPLDLPMCDVVYDLLVARRSLGDATWVFPSASASGHLEEPKFALAQVAASSGIRVSTHDLRRSFVTIAESTDMSVLALKALVNHSLGRGDVTSSYIQMSADRLREPAQRVADRLKTLCGIAPIEGGNVAKLKL